MTTYAIADELECYPVWTPGVVETTTGAIAGVSRGGISIPNNATDYVELPLRDSVTGAVTSCNDVLWLHFRRYTGDGGTARTPVIWYRSDNTPVLREYVTGNFTGKMQMWNGTAWVDIITAGPATYYQTFQDWDFRVKIAATGGIVEVFRDGVLQGQFLGDTSSINNVGKVRFYNRGGAHIQHQVILADYSTISHTVRRRTPTGAGANSGWTGTYAEIDDTPSGTIGTDVVSISASEVKSTFTAAALAAPTNGHVVKAVAVAVFCKNDGTGTAPQNLKLVLRAGGLDYESPANATIGVGWTGGQAFWENNPNTGAAWANITAVNNTEFGIISKD